MGAIEKDHRKRNRRVAAAGLGAALTLPLAPPAAAMIPMEDGGARSVSPTEPAHNGTAPVPAQPAAEPAAPAPADPKPAPAPATHADPQPAAEPQPAPQVTPQRVPTPQSLLARSKADEPAPAAPQPAASEPVAAAPRTPADPGPATPAPADPRPAPAPATHADPQPAAEPPPAPQVTPQRAPTPQSYIARSRADRPRRPAPAAPATPTAAQPSVPTARADAGPAVQPPPAAPRRPEPRPAATREPDPQPATQRQPAPQVTPQRAPTPESVAARTPIPPQAGRTSSSPPSRTQPAQPQAQPAQPQAQPAQPQAQPTEPQPEPTTSTPPVAVHTVYGMDSRTFDGLPPQQQQAVENEWNAEHGIGAPPTDSRFTPQAGGHGPTIGSHQPANPGTSFPGSVTVACSEQVPAIGHGPCELPLPGAPAKPDGSLRVTLEATSATNRSDPVRGEDGVERTSLDVTTRVTTRGRAGVDGGRVKLGVEDYAGLGTTYRVTVEPDKADRIEDGTAELPNPYNPLSLDEGDGIELTDRRFQGSTIDGGTGLLSAGVDHQTSTGTSSAVQRVDATTARVIVGDKQSVTNALTLGVGPDSLGVAISKSNTTERAHLTSVDLDLSTKAGWDAYQRFVADGELPAVTDSNEPGVVDATTGGSVTRSSGVTASLTAGPVNLAMGHTSVDGVVTWARHPDGTKDTTFMSGGGDVDVNVDHTVEPDGSQGASTYWLDLKDATTDSIEGYLGLQQGREVDRGDGDRGARLSFTQEDLSTLRHNVLLAISQQLENSRAEPMSPEEIARQLREGSPLPVAPQALTGLATEVAAAESPLDILGALAQTTASNPTALLEDLQRAQWAEGQDRRDIHFAGRLEVYDDK